VRDAAFPTRCSTHVAFATVAHLIRNFALFSGHYTGHFKSVVTKPQNVYVLRDIMANGYRAGCNTKFFSPDGDFDSMRTAIQSRLNFENLDSDDVEPSLLAFPMALAQVESIQNEITVTTRLLPWDVHGAPGDRHKSFPGGQKMYEFYNGAMQLEQIHFGEDLRASENMEYITQVRGNHLIAHTIICILPNPFATHRVSFDCVHRARRTTRSASRAPTASTTRSPRPTRRSCRAWATGAPTPAREM
jgi:hypothetical protein